MDNKDIIALLAKGDASTSPADIVALTGQMTPEQAAQTRGNLGAAAAETVVEVSGTTPTIEPQANTVYNCGELTSLTISNPPATGAYSIVFTSSATSTTAIIPPSPAMRWQTDDNEPPQGFPAANTRYEINVKNTYVVLGEWPVPEVTP